MAWFSLAQGRNLPGIWIAIKAGAAGVILILDSRAPQRGEERRWLLGLAISLLALALLVLFNVPLPSCSSLVSPDCCAGSWSMAPCSPRERAWCSASSGSSAGAGPPPWLWTGPSGWRCWQTSSPPSTSSGAPS